MKKNYNVPSTEVATWASMGLMQEIGFATVTASGGGSTPQTINDKDLID